MADVYSDVELNTKVASPLVSLFLLRCVLFQR